MPSACLSKFTPQLTRIITTKNLHINEGGIRNISYDGQIVREIISENEDILENIFKTGSSVKKGEEIKIVADTDIYDKGKFLRVTQWKIIK